MKINEVTERPIVEGISQVANVIVDKLNDEFTAQVGMSPMSKEVGRDVPWAPFEVRSGSMRRWTRGDGQTYKDPNRIGVPNHSYSHLEKAMTKKQLNWLNKNGQQQGMVDRAWESIKSLPGIKHIGQISKGPYGSDEYTDLYLYQNTLFWRYSDFAIAFSTKSRLRNKGIWRSK